VTGGTGGTLGKEADERRVKGCDGEEEQKVKRRKYERHPTEFGEKSTPVVTSCDY